MRGIRQHDTTRNVYSANFNGLRNTGWHRAISTHHANCVCERSYNPCVLHPAHFIIWSWGRNARCQTRDQVLREIAKETNETNNSAVDKVRTKYLRALQEKSGRNIICYYSGFLSKPKIEGVELNDEDRTVSCCASTSWIAQKDLIYSCIPPAGMAPPRHRSFTTSRRCLARIFELSYLKLPCLPEH